MTKHNQFIYLNFRVNMAIQLDKICRTCMCSSNVLLPVFDGSQENSKDAVFEMLRAIDIIAMADDKLPTNMCIACIAELNKAFSFQIRAKRCERTLRTYLKNYENELTVTDKAQQHQESSTCLEISTNVTVQAQNRDLTNEKVVINLSYTCEICGLRVKDKQALQIHLTGPSHLAKYCSTCDLFFIDQGLLDEHNQTEHSSDMPVYPSRELQSNVCDFACKDCDIVFVRKKNYENHIARYHHTSNEPMHVEEVLESQLKEHKVTEETSKITCTRCNAFFAREKSLQIHLRNGKCTELKYACSICQRVFDQKQNLDRHTADDHKEKDQPDEDHPINRKYTCNYCNRGFKMASTLKDHIRVHTNEKPFLCPQCGKAFSQSTNMKMHLLRHSKIKLFKCGYETCTSSFVSKGELNSHLRIHTGDHPFVCDICTARFTTASSLAKHKRIHTGERPYACEFCPMRFTALGTLKNHRRTHTGEKPYACSYCAKAFAQNCDLVAHLRTHTGIRPYKCPICALTFQHKNVLKKHEKIHEKSTSVSETASELASGKKQ